MSLCRATVAHVLAPLAIVACASTGGGTSANGAFHDTAETWAELRSLAARHPDRAQTLSAGRSLEGREIPALVIGDSSGSQEGRPNIYVLGCQHAREWISVEVPLGFGRYLLEGGADDPAAQRAVREARFYVLPILNPDGLEFSIHTDRSWRKNRRPNGDGSWGVDLNRNYPLGWECLGSGAGGVTTSDGYRGLLPFSEPESQALRDFMLLHPPAGVIEYHSHGAIIYPPLPRRVTAGDIELWAVVEPKMAQLMFSVHGQAYAASGSDRSFEVGDVPDPTRCGMLGQLFNWTRDRFGAPSFLIELPPASYLGGAFYPPESAIDGIVEEQIPAILYFADYVANGP